MDQPQREAYCFDPESGFRRVTPGTPAGSLDEIGLARIPPILRTVLVADGTVTKFLEAYFWEPIQVETLEQEDATLDEDLPALDLKKGAKVLRRLTRCRGLHTKRVFLGAELLGSVDFLWRGFKDDLQSGRLGVGELLRNRRIETYREILSIRRESPDRWNEVLELKSSDSVLCRRYRIFAQGRAGLLITDVFPEAKFWGP